MKKLLICTAATLLTVAAFAQGTVFFSNSGFEKISSGLLGSAPSTWTVVPTTAGLVNYGLFYGVGATQPSSLTFLGVEGVNSTSTAGVIANPADGTSAVTVLAIPGATGGAANVWVQIAGWSASLGTDWAASQHDSRRVLRRDHRHQRPPSGSARHGPWYGALAVRHRHEPEAVRGWLRAVLGCLGGP